MADSLESNLTEEDVENKLMTIRTNVIAAFGVEPKPVQLQCWRSLLRGNNIFVIAPTGYGKGLIFQGLSFLKEDGIVFIIVPLKAIMSDQVLIPVSSSRS